MLLMIVDDEYYQLEKICKGEVLVELLLEVMTVASKVFLFIVPIISYWLQEFLSSSLYYYLSIWKSLIS